MLANNELFMNVHSFSSRALEMARDHGGQSASCFDQSATELGDWLPCADLRRVFLGRRIDAVIISVSSNFSAYEGRRRAVYRVSLDSVTERNERDTRCRDYNSARIAYRFRFIRAVVRIGRAREYPHGDWQTCRCP